MNQRLVMLHYIILTYLVESLVTQLHHTIEVCLYLWHSQWKLSIAILLLLLHYFGSMAALLHQSRTIHIIKYSWSSENDAWLVPLYKPQTVMINRPKYRTLSLSFSDRYYWIFPWKSQSFCQIIIRILHGRISITVLASINNVSYYEVCHGQTAQTNNNSGESESHGFCIVTPLRLIRKWQFA